MPNEQGATPTAEYDIRTALHEAATLLSNEFGEADQAAAVELATFLWRSHGREEFTKRNPQPDNISTVGS